MKKLLVVVGIVLSLCAVAYANPIGGTGGPAAVYEAYSYRNITAADNTVVKATPGILAGIVVNGGTMGALTIYDNTTASTTTVATIASPYAGQVIPLGIQCTTGISINQAAATNITVVYK